MKMRIIDIIELVDMRNKNLVSDKPMGISIDKYFMPSVANTIGVDLKTYKLVPHNCFACNLMHVGRDERVPMAINKKEDPVLVSPAYLVFRVKESVDVLPDFFMLWFRRPTFDRNAWFFTAGDVRGGLGKKDFFNMEVHVPDIATQRRIVAEYQTVEIRISGLYAMLKNEEETMKAIFLSHFERKSDQTILQQGWRFAELGEFCDFFTGKKDVNQSLPEGKYRFFSCSSGNYYSNEAISNGPAVIIAGNGYTGRTTFSAEPFDLYQRAYACMLKPSVKHDLIYFIYVVAKFLFEPSCQDEARGTTIQYIVKGDLEHFTFTYEESAAVFCNKVIKVLLSHTLLIQNEIECMGKLKSLLLSKLA